MTNDLKTLEGVVFWTDTSNFRKVQELLKDKYNFVNARTWDTKFKDEYWFDDCLVYEENGNGLFRCSFHRIYPDAKNFKPCDEHLDFKYFHSNKLSTELLVKDPLREVVLNVYDLLKPVRVTNYGFEEFSME